MNIKKQFMKNEQTIIIDEKVVQAKELLKAINDSNLAIIKFLQDNKVQTNQQTPPAQALSNWIVESIISQVKFNEV